MIIFWIWEVSFRFPTWFGKVLFQSAIFPVVITLLNHETIHSQVQWWFTLSQKIYQQLLWIGSTWYCWFCWFNVCWMSFKFEELSIWSDQFCKLNREWMKLDCTDQWLQILSWGWLNFSCWTHRRKSNRQQRFLLNKCPNIRSTLQELVFHPL